MDKVYLLLRNNQETGPHSLEEILQIGLTPNDLVWVEGKSCSWSYPSEIETLKPYIPQPNIEATEEVKGASPMLSPSYAASDTIKTSIPKTNPPKYVYVSLPANFSKRTAQEFSPEQALEQKAEELRRRAQAYLSSTENKVTTADDLDEPVYSNTLNDLEKQYASWHHTQKIKKKRRLFKRTAITVVTILVLGAGYVLAKEDIHIKNNNTKELFVKNKLEAKKTAPLIAKEPESFQQEFSTMEGALPISGDSVQQASSNKPTAKKKNDPSTSLQANTKIAVPTIKDIEGEAIPETTPVITTTKVNDDLTAPQQKKKTLGAMIGNLFKPKHNRTEEKPEITPAPSETSEIKIDNSKKAPPLADLIDLSYTSSFNQTTGLQDLNFTLKNRSNETIKGASVEVRYYNARNNLLEKKVINFADVPPKNSITATIPNNRLADHTYYYLLPATN